MTAPRTRQIALSDAIKTAAENAEQANLRLNSLLNLLELAQSSAGTAPELTSVWILLRDTHRDALTVRDAV